MKCKCERKLLFGDPAEMGTDEDLEKEFDEMDAEDAEFEAAERQEADDEEYQKKMEKRGTKGLTRFD